MTASLELSYLHSNELSSENLSKTEEVFVQAGDIVKGGQQDRVLAVDLIMPARSGKIPIHAFCVEHTIRPIDKRFVSLDPTPKQPDKK